MIGRGGCGEVYKAELPGSNKIIAIKKVVQPSKDEAKLSGEDISRPNCHYLVYEYMKNGSLRGVLNQVLAGARELDWLARHKIAVGVASGLEYLHMHNTPRIIHMDLKPENILLDGDMEARITDSGLAKAMPEAYTHVLVSHANGTIGYTAQEFYYTGRFNDKCDMVVLGVLVTGKTPLDDFFEEAEGRCLSRWMRNVMTSDNPTRVIDEKLRGSGVGMRTRCFWILRYLAYALLMILRKV
ncbi:hypothetical protein K1719_020795 [Acacia pycnantha]|nr:hypothetical protein K1719_020795 [Acacia pycnantha]